MDKKQVTQTRIMLLTLFSFILSIILVIGLTINHNSFPFSFAGGEKLEHSITLNGDLKVTSNGDHTFKTKEKNNVRFTYTNVKSSTSGHVSFNQGGTLINKDHLRSIETITAVFDTENSLSFKLSFDGTTVGGETTMVSGYTYQIGSAPYFVHFSALKDVTISSIKITYSCMENPNAHEGEEGGEDVIYYQKVYDDSDLESGTYLIVYESTETVAKVLNGSLSKIDAQSNHITASIETVNNKNVIYQSTEVDNAAFILSGSNGSYSARSTAGYYIYSSGSKNNLSQSESEQTLDIAFYDESISVDSSDRTLRFNTSDSRFRFYGSGQQPISLYKYVVSSTGPSFDPPEESIIGFTASDTKASSYYNDDVFDTANNLHVYANKTGGTQIELSKGESDGYSYKVYNSNDVEIDTSKAFGEEGIYTLVVSYKNFIPAEIVLTVGYRVALTSIEATCEKLIYNTADRLSSYLTLVGANLTYNKPSYNTSVTYNEFSDKDLALKLLDPNGVEYNINNVFGTAGTWTIKVLSNANPSIYGTLEITVEAILITNITVTGSSTTLEEEQQLQLQVSITPDTATDKSVTWSSSDDSIAEVNQNGLVSAKKEGNVRITATANDDSEVYGYIDIEVTKKAEVTEFDASIFTGTNSLQATVNGNAAIKVGTGKAGGNMSITVGAGATKLSFYAAAWSGGSTTISLSDINASPDSVELSADTGISGSSTSYTLSGEESSYYHEVILTDVTSETTLTISAARRFVLWNAKYYTQQIDPIYPTSISLSGQSPISIGGTTGLTVTYTPEDTTVKHITFTSDDTNVATVSSEGIVTGVSAGNTVIRVTAEGENGNINASFNIRVDAISVTSVTLNKTSTTLSVGDTETLVATINPSDATNKNVTWTSDNTSVATVSNGVVSAVAAGSATITVKSVDGNKTATCDVTVNKAAAVTHTITYTDLKSQSYETTRTEHTSSTGLKFITYNCSNFSSKMQFKASVGYLESNESLELSTITINNRESNTLTVYGSNTAGSFSQTITGTGTNNDTYNLSGYHYFKIARTTTGAAYCASITIEVGEAEPTDPTAIKVTPATVELGPNGTKELSISYTPSNANQHLDVTWTRSSGASTISVDSSGKVSVASNASEGQTAIIRATLDYDATIYSECTVTVADNTADQTILLYLCGSDLESNGQTSSSQAAGYATGDIKEILSVTQSQPDDVNFVIETGGAKSWKSTYGINPDYLERYHVANGKLVRDAQLTRANMNNASTLQSFVTYGLQNYPANRTGLILWNHGGAMRGVCYDDWGNNDALLNSEVHSAVGGSFNDVGRSTSNKLEWIGYDACLMQVQDIADFNSDYFNYMVASEESEAGDGWDYDNWVDDLYRKVSTESLLTTICTTFLNDVGTNTDQTLSWLDLSYMSAYKTAWENVAQKITASNISKSNFQTLMKTVKYYGSDSDCEGYSYFGIFDALDALNKFAANSTINNVGSSEISAAKSAFSNLVKCSKKGSQAGNSNGLCCFFPMKDGSGYTCSTSTYYSTSQTNFTYWRSVVTSKGD